jgi:hypothetical protein
MEGEQDRRRRGATALGYRGLAADLLRGDEPSENDLTLLCVAVADAAVSGDRQLLEGIYTVTDRLRSYLPVEEAWAEEWRGRFWSLGQMAVAAGALLEVERHTSIV